MPHPYWLQNAIRRNPRSAGPGEAIAAPPEFDEAADRDGVPVAPVQTKPQRKKRPVRREAPIGRSAGNPRWNGSSKTGSPSLGMAGQAALERYVADVLAARGYHPAESTIRGYVRRWIDEYRGRVNKGSLRAEPHLTY
jgi:hypothetical protein